MMDRQKQFIEFYQRHRVEDQLNYYHSRRKEFEAAQLQTSWLAGVVMILASGFAFLSASSIGPVPTLWRVLAAALPAVSAAVASFQRLFAFERLAKLYQDAATALRTIEGAPTDDSEANLQAYVTKVERIFAREQGQWGQLTADLQLPDLGEESRGPELSHEKPSRG